MPTKKTQKKPVTNKKVTPSRKKGGRKPTTADKKASPSVSVSALREQTRGMERLGSIVYWTLTTDTEVSRPDLEPVMAATLGSQYMPHSPKTKRAVRRALLHLEHEGFLRKIRDDNKLMAYVIVDEKVDKENVDLEIEKANTVILDKETNEVSFRTQYLQDEIEQRIEHFGQVFTAEDLRTAVVGYLKDHGGVTLRDMGGIYFVVNDVAARLETFFGHFSGHGWKLYNIPIADVAQARNQLTSAVQNEIQNDIQTASEELERLIKADNTRNSSFLKKIQEFKLLRQKAEVYNDLISEEVETFQNSIAELTQRVQNALTDAVDEYPQAAEFPLNSRIKYGGRAVKKHGEFGTVVGYFTNSALRQNNQFVKVQFDGRDKSVLINSTQLAPATEAVDSQSEPVNEEDAKKTA